MVGNKTNNNKRARSPILNCFHNLGSQSFGGRTLKRTVGRRAFETSGLWLLRRRRRSRAPEESCEKNRPTKQSAMSAIKPAINQGCCIIDLFYWLPLPL